MIEVVVSRLGMDPTNQTYVVVLQERGGERLLPIWIGKPEAESIIMHMHDIQRERPITHDLCRTIIGGLGATLRRAQVTRMAGNTYFAELHLERGGEAVIVDSRPSDAIAIALRLDAPIYVAEQLLSSAEDSAIEGGETFTESSQSSAESSGLTAEQLKEYLEHLGPEDFGKFNL